MKVNIFTGVSLFHVNGLLLPKMVVNSYRMKSSAVTKGGRTKIITNKTGGYFTERLVTTPERWKPKKLP